MSGDTTQQLMKLIDRLKSGDPRARNELIERAMDRIRRISLAILHRSFPNYRQHEDTVFQESALRLMKAMETVELADPEHFLRLVAQKVRQTLLDLVEKERRPLPPAAKEDDSTLDPSRLAEWTEFHQRTAELPPDQRAVVELHFYAGLTQAETAEVLGAHPRAVSRLWVRATEPLMHLLPPT